MRAVDMDLLLFFGQGSEDVGGRMIIRRSLQEFADVCFEKPAAIEGRTHVSMHAQPHHAHHSRAGLQHTPGFGMKVVELVKRLGVRPLQRRSGGGERTRSRQHRAIHQHALPSLCSQKALRPDWRIVQTAEFRL